MATAERAANEAAREKRIGRMSDALGDVTTKLARLAERVAAFDNPQVKEFRNAVTAFEWSTRRQGAFTGKVLESAQQRSEDEQVRARVFERIRHAVQRPGPIVAGPWTGEVGFELLYWAPFVRWATKRFGIDPDRLTVLSRGGTASWYGIEGAHYRDVLELCAPDEFRQRTLKERKQRALRLFDRQLLRRARSGTGDRAAVLHPAMMYALYAPFWSGRSPARWVQQFAAFARVQPPVIQDLQLPREYVAVRFYFSKCFPETPGNQALVSGLVEGLARETDVVLLGSGVSLDEHRDLTIGRSGRVHTVEDLLRPETNLAVQTAVIAGAQAFIGTYGGFSYLAPLCGVNTVALYSRRNYYAHHLDFAQQLFTAVGGGSLSVIDAAHASWTPAPNRST